MGAEPPPSARRIIGKSTRRPSTTTSKKTTDAGGKLRYRRSYSRNRSSSSLISKQSRRKEVPYSSSQTMAKLDPSSAASVASSYRPSVASSHREKKESLKKARRLTRKQQLLQHESKHKTTSKEHRHHLQKHRVHKRQEQKHHEKEDKHKEQREPEAKQLEPSEHLRKTPDDDQSHRDQREPEPNLLEPEQVEPEPEPDVEELLQLEPEQHLVLPKQREHSHNAQQKQQVQEDPPIPAVVSRREYTREYTRSPMTLDDDTTFRTNRTLGTFNTFNTFNTHGTQLSVVTAQYSVGGGWDSGSCGIGMLNPFTTGARSLHDRIRHQLEMACSEGYHGRGTRLHHLAVSQKTIQANIDSSSCGRHIPLSFYGTLESMKERFRSEAVAETWCADSEKEPLAVKLQKKIPTKEELAHYANQAKIRLLDTIEALEKVRNKAGQTLGPAIERLRKETEKACIETDEFFTDHYTCLVAATQECFEETVDGKGKVVDPPEGDDESLKGDEIPSTPDHGILIRLKKATSAFLRNYAALLSSKQCTAPETDPSILLELPDDFGQDSNKLGQQEEAADCNSLLKKGSQRLDKSKDSDDPGDSGEELVSAEDVPERSMDPTTEHETTESGIEENPDAIEVTDAFLIEAASEEVGEEEGKDGRDAPEGGSKSPRRAVEPEPQMKTVEPKPETGPHEPDGAKSPDDKSVEESLAADGANSKNSKQKAVKKNLMVSTRNDSGEQAESSSSFGDIGDIVYPINFLESSQADPSTILNQDSASILNRLRKIKNDKKKIAMSVFGDVASEITRNDSELSYNSGVQDEDSLVTNGTEENPIVLLDESSEILERPKVDKSSSRKRRAVSPKSRDAERLLGLEDQSTVSALTATATSYTSFSNRKGQMKEDLHELVDEFLGTREERHRSPNRLEAAEHLLSSLRAHMDDRHDKDKRSNRFLGAEESDTSEISTDYEVNARIFPISMEQRPKSKILPARGQQYKARMAVYNREPEPEIIRVDDYAMMNPPTINLVTTNSDIQPPEDPEPPIHHKSKLLADPSRHAKIEEDNKPDTYIASHSKSKLLADPHRHSRIKEDKKPEPMVVPRHKSKLLADPHRHSRIGEDKKPEPKVVSRHKSKLLADPHRHAIMEESKREQIAITQMHLNPTHSVLSNTSLEKPEMIDLTSLPAESRFASRYRNIRPEQRDDQQVQATRDPPIETPTRANQHHDISNAFLYRDPRYHGEVQRPSRPPLQPPSTTPPGTTRTRQTTAGKANHKKNLKELFRDRKPPSSSSLPSESSEAKSVTSSILGKRIPGRSKSVSFNLPDDDEESSGESNTMISPSNHSFSRRSGSSRSRSGSTTAALASSQSYDERAAAARRELARLSQRQASLVARGQQFTSTRSR